MTSLSDRHIRYSSELFRRSTTSNHLEAAKFHTPPGGHCSGWGPHCTLNRLFDDRQVDDRRRNAEGNRQPPHRIVAVVMVEHDAAQPDAKEAADLMAQEIGRA